MQIILNGSHEQVTAATVSELVTTVVEGSSDGVAVAVDGQVVPRSQWSRVIREGEVVDILTAVQGG